MAKKKETKVPESFRLHPGLIKPISEAAESEMITKAALYNLAIKEYLEKRGYITSKKKQ